MALFYPDILRSNNPAAYATALAAETGGHRQVKNLAALYAVADCILSASGANTDNDALGQLFYVQSEQAFYQLTSWAGRRQASGWKRTDFATLGTDGKVPLSQLPDIDTALYKVVTALPEDGIDDNKIYLVANPAGETGNTYTEYVRANGQWEKLGERQAETDLSGYVRFTDTATEEKAGVMSAADKQKLDTFASEEGITEVMQYVLSAEWEIGLQENSVGIQPVMDDGTVYGGFSIPAATATAAGVMSAADKGRLETVYGQLLSGSAYATGNWINGKSVLAAVQALDTALKAANTTIQQLQQKVSALESALTLKEQA